MLQKTTKGRIFKIAICGLLFFVAIFLLPQITNAQVETGLNYVEETGLSDSDPRVVIAKVIRVALGFLGIVALLLILYAGFLYMTSGGEPGKVDIAKKILSNAAIGLIIILAAFGIATFILNALMGINNGGLGGRTSPGNTRFNGGVPASGNSVIESHYPGRNQRDVPRNTSIVITFKEPMDPTQIINNDTGGILGDYVDTNNNGRVDVGEAYDSVNENIVLIYQSDNGPDTLITDVYVSKSDDNRTYRFKPVTPLGSPSVDIWHTVLLSSDLTRMNGQRAFSGTGGYEWEFLVNTIIDLTPPRVTSIIPREGRTEPRNVVVQVNFNEPINPLTGSGSYVSPGLDFDNITITNLSAGPNVRVEGNFYISNAYRTVEFLTEDFCGRNSCGENVYCLPATSSLEVLVRAATLSGSPPTAFYDTMFGFDGIVDMADNSLDGNRDGEAEGPVSNFNQNDPGFTPIPGDNYRWDFRTNDEIIITSANIIEIYPDINTQNVDQSERPWARFDRLMMSSSMIKHAPPAIGSVALYALNGAADVSFYLLKRDDRDLDQTTIEIKHGPFEDNGEYAPEFNSNLRDIYQNCFNPGSWTDAGGVNCSSVESAVFNLTPVLPYCCNNVLSNNPCY